jgi:Tfp pilus assembly protein FimT
MGLGSHRSRWAQAGSSIGELALVVAIVGILSVLATPLFLTYYQASVLRVGAEEIAAFLNQGRQLAIRQNGSVCVHITPTAMHYHLGTCVAEDPATIVKGAGTDAAGNLKAPSGVTLTTTANPAFSYLGAAAPAATYTVTNTQTAATLRVVVAASGRICIAPNLPSCP